MSAPLIVERREAVLHVTLNRPEKLNAIDGAMGEALLAALAEADRDSAIRSIVLAGAGRAFCAGQDLSDPAVAPGSDLGAAIERVYNPLIRAMRALPKPIVAAVRGTAAGAGANLAFAADLVIATRSAKFVEAFARIGLLPDSGGTWMLPRLVGHARAVGLAMLGEPLPAEQAHAWGAIWSVVDDDALDAQAQELAQRLATMPTAALGAIKLTLAAGWSHSLDAQLERERDGQRTLGATHDYREGVAAFTAKRAPRFEGR